MDQINKDSYFPNCLYTYDKDDEIGSITGKLRHQILHSHKVSLTSFNNQQIVHLLNNKLDLLNNHFEHDKHKFFDHYLKEKNLPRKEYKNNTVNIGDFIKLKKLECSKEMNCHNSEIIDEENFENFISLMYSKPLEQNVPCRKIPVSFQKNSKSKKADQDSEETSKTKALCDSFKTARELLEEQEEDERKKNDVPPQKRKFGPKRSFTGKFVSPLLSNVEKTNEKQTENNSKSEKPIVDERLKNVDPQMIEFVMSEIMEIGQKTTWDDIAGLQSAKNAIQEAVVWPLLRPDIFKGLRRPPKGILLFGPPGTGKTLIGKCVACQSNSTFFSISASSIASKWIGDGEKMVRALFAVARCHQPAVIFIDEVDSLLSQRSETEHESSRRIKTEFLVQLDGATTDGEDRILLIGATNRPQELDEAARRRFTKRLYIPLPNRQARCELLMKLLSKEQHTLNTMDFEKVAESCEGFSGADVRNLCSEAALEPIRSIDISQLNQIDVAEVRPLSVDDFIKAFKAVRASVASKDLKQYVEWDKIYGSGNSS